MNVIVRLGSTRGLSRKLAAAACGVMLLSAAPALAQDGSKPFSDSQIKQLESVIRDFILSNPDVVLDALHILQNQQQMAEAEKQKLAVADNRSVLFDDPNAPVLGNPDGDVAMVEFFDYQCGYCKRMFEPLMHEIEQDGKVKLIMKEFPILGPMSVVASKAALAARKQGKYQEMHFGLMGFRGQLTEEAIYAVAEDVGLDVDRLKTDMESDDIAAMLRANYDLSEALDIRGTPAFVIGNELIPGAISDDALKGMIAKARSS